MSQYNAAPLSAADNAARDATDLELAPFLPTTNQSGDRKPPAPAGVWRPVGSKTAEPVNVGFVSLHNKAEFAGIPIISHHTKTCAACAALFPTNHRLEQHAFETKHKAYLCSCGCQKGFTKRSALRRHIQESVQSRQHRCSLCDHKFKRPGHVEQHLRLVHNKPKDEIKRILNTQKSEPHRESEKTTTASADISTTRPVVTRTNYPAMVPVGPWNGPSGLYAAAHVEHLGARPGHFPAFFPVPGTAQVTASPAFTPQNFVVQTPGFPVYPPYPACPVGASPAPTGFIANPVPGFSTYPAAPLDGTNNFFNVNPGPVSVNSSDGFEMPDVGLEFTMDFSGLDFDTFGI